MMKEYENMDHEANVEDWECLVQREKCQEYSVAMFKFLKGFFYEKQINFMQLLSAELGETDGNQQEASEYKRSLCNNWNFTE